MDPLEETVYVTNLNKREKELLAELGESHRRAEDEDNIYAVCQRVKTRSQMKTPNKRIQS